MRRFNYYSASHRGLTGIFKYRADYDSCTCCYAKFASGNTVRITHANYRELRRAGVTEIQDIPNSAAAVKKAMLMIREMGV